MYHFVTELSEQIKVINSIIQFNNIISTIGNSVSFKSKIRNLNEALRSPFVFNFRVMILATEFNWTPFKPKWNLIEFDLS